jgi:hypothetical protein
MAVQTQGFSGTVDEVDAYKRSRRISIVARGPSYAIAAQTGTIAAALGANSAVFAMRLDPAAGAAYKAYIDRIRLQWTTIVAFTTPITAGRRLALFRGAGAATSGGTPLATVVKKDTADGNSQFASGEGGQVSIATTAALTVAGITFEADPFRIMTLVQAGAAGAFAEAVFEFNPSDAGGPVVLGQGELLAIRNPVAMDAAGTWQLGVNVDWIEGAL